MKVLTPFARQRHAAGYSQSGLARRLRLTPAAVGKWDAGESLPDPLITPRIAKLLKIKPVDVLDLIQASATTQADEPALATA